MKMFSFKKAMLSFGITGLMMTGIASAQVYYPVEIQVTDPNGKPESYTMYIPGEVKAGMIYQQQKVAVTNENGVTEYQTIYIPSARQTANTSSSGSYELSSNPWDETPSAPVQKVAVTSPETAASIVNNTATNAELQRALSSQINVLNANTSANTAQVAAAPVATGENGNLRDMPLPEWVGHNTTYNTAYGQEMIAPEINKTNMLSIVKHLRKLGYIVPDSLDTAIAEAPSKTKLKMMEAIEYVQGGGGSTSDPITQAFAKISKDLEANYGFSFENILGTSLNILDSK